QGYASLRCPRNSFIAAPLRNTDNTRDSVRCAGAGLNLKRIRIMANSFGSQAMLRVGDLDFTIFRLEAAAKAFPRAAHLPFSLKILLENLLRTEDGKSVRAEDIQAL